MFMYRRLPVTGGLLAVALLSASGAAPADTPGGGHGHAAAQAEMSVPPAADPHARHRMQTKRAPSATASTHIDLSDAELVTQDQATVKLKSELLGDKVVVMNFVYTSCTTVCPVLSAIFSQVQERLGERLGNDVVLVSISVDPMRDTPDRLKAYAAKHQAANGWTWLTGHKPVVDGVLQELGVYTANFEDHPSMVLVGSAATGQWSRFLGFPNSDDIVAKVEELLANPDVASTH
ncbi:MAG: SCO family protein [Gammaproteobacteria bacterium]|nr:SCO family protein [Gammaproteobacteria bacterium]